MRPEIVPIISAMGWAVDSIMVRRGARTSSVLSAAYLSYLVTTILTWSYVALNFPLSIVRSPQPSTYGQRHAPASAGADFPLHRHRAPRSRPGHAPSGHRTDLLRGHRGARPARTSLGHGLSWEGLFVVAGGWMVLYRRGHEAKGDWRLLDALYPLAAGLLAGISQNFRRAGLLILPNPFVAGAVTTGTSLTIFTIYLWIKGQFSVVKPSRESVPTSCPPPSSRPSRNSWCSSR